MLVCDRLCIMHSFSVTLANIAINNISLKTGKVAYTLPIGKGFGKACTDSRKRCIFMHCFGPQTIFYISQTTAKTESVQKARCTDFVYLNSVNKVIWLLNNLISNLENSFYLLCYIRIGVKTLRTQDTSDPRHFGTIKLVYKCLDSSTPVPKCITDTLALVMNCLDLQQPFFATIGPTEGRFNITRYYY